MELTFRKRDYQLGVVVHTCNVNILEAEENDKGFKAMVGYLE